jgi:hypothetical protein
MVVKEGEEVEGLVLALGQEHGEGQGRGQGEQEQAREQDGEHLLAYG